VKPHLRNLFISLVIVAVFAVGGFYLLSRNAQLPEHPLERVPSEAQAAVWVNVPALLHSSIYRRLIADGEHEASLRALTERCGFNPLEQVSNATAFVTGSPRTLEHVGFVAEGDFDHEALGTCLRSAVEADGGSLSEKEIEGARAVATGEGKSVAAFIGRRGILVGYAETVAAAVRTVSGRDGNLGQNEALRALWDRLAREREFVAVAALPEHWQDELRRLLGTARAGQVLPYLAELRTLGASARLSRGLAMTLVSVMETERAATALATGASDALERINRNPIVAISPVGAILAELHATAQGKEVTVAFDITQERLDRIFGFADRMLERLTGAGTPSPSQPAAPAPATAPAQATPAAAP
jgi:hypothetical protein